MAESTPIQTFGIARVVPYNLTTGIPYGSLRVLQNSSFTTTGELVENRGGASKYPWAIAEADINAELRYAGIALISVLISVVQLLKHP